MISTPRISSNDSAPAEQAPRRGPVPLAPELLAHVSGGQSDDGAPRGRWTPIEPLLEIGDDGAPRGRW